jgi:hypothetical protein
MVRQWRLKTQTDNDIRRLLGEEEKRYKRSEMPDIRAFRKDVRRMVAAVLDGEYDKGEQAAMKIIDLYQL